MSRRRSAGLPFATTRAYILPVLLWLVILVAAWVIVNELSGHRLLADWSTRLTDWSTRQVALDSHQQKQPGESSGNHHGKRAQHSELRLPSAPAKWDKIEPATQAIPGAAPPLYWATASKTGPADQGHGAAARRAASQSKHADQSPSGQQQTASKTKPENKPGKKATPQSQHKTATAGSDKPSSSHAVASAPPKTGRSASSSAATKTTTSAHVARAQLTSGIAHNEPIDRITRVFHSQHKALQRLYYFTQFKGLSGTTVTHRWYHNGRLMAKVSFRVTSNSWRSYSAKKLTPSMAGSWRVVVSDNLGHTLSSASFIYKVP